MCNQRSLFCLLTTQMILSSKLKANGYEQYYFVRHHFNQQRQSIEYRQQFSLLLDFEKNAIA